MKWVTGLFIFFVIVFVAGANSRQLPPFINDLYNFPGGDKVGHVIVMGILNFLVCLTVVSSDSKHIRRKIIGITCIIAVIVTLEEMSQKFLVHRTFSLGLSGCKADL